MLSIQSPYSAEALVLGVEKPFVYSRRTGECRNITKAEIGQWLTSHGEVRYVNVENLTELENSLALYADCRTALRLALYSADGDLDESLREQMITLLEALLNEPNVRNWLHDLFCLQELTQDSIKIAKSSLRYAEKNSLTHCVSFYNNILENQPVIRHISAIWDLIEESSFFGNQHRSLMDRALGTGIFGRIVMSKAKPDLFEIALLVVLKLRSKIDLNITKEIFQAHIINKVISDHKVILGHKDIVNGLEYFNLWSLVDAGNVQTGKPIFSVRLKSTESPFALEHNLGVANLVISAIDNEDFTSVPQRLAHHLTTRVFAAQVQQPRILPDNKAIESLNSVDKNENSVLSKVQAWSNKPLPGACKPSHRVVL